MTNNTLVWGTKTVKVKDLVEYDRNPRTISEEKFNKLKQAIAEEGFRTPPCVDEKGMLLAGHQRIRAMIDAGLGDLDITVSVPPEGLELTEELKKRIVARDNLSWGDWDKDILFNDYMPDELMDLGFDADFLGLDLDDLEEVLEPEVDEDSVPEAPKIPKTVRGDVYEIGNHRLMCGDSTSIDDVDKLMGGVKADMVFTDPPYGVEYKNNMNKKFDVIKNDDKFLEILPILTAVSNNNIHWYIWTSQQVYNVWREMFSSKYKNTIIWYKGGGGIGDLAGDYALNYEMCLFCQFGRRELNGKRDGAVWEIKKDFGGKYVHPTQKPVELSEYAIDKSSSVNNVVLDLFGGSGSTMLGCHKTKRIAYLMELDEKYCDVIVTRMKRAYPELVIKRNGEVIEWEVE